MAYPLPSELTLLSEMISKKILRHDHDLSQCVKETQEIYDEIEKEWFPMLKQCVIHDMQTTSTKCLKKQMGGKWLKKYKKLWERKKPLFSRFLRRYWHVRAKKLGYLRQSKALFVLLQRKAPSEKVYDAIRSFNPPGKWGNNAPGWDAQMKINAWCRRLRKVNQRYQALLTFQETNEMIGRYSKMLMEEKDGKKKKKKNETKLKPIYISRKTLTRKQEKRKRHREEEANALISHRVKPDTICKDPQHGGKMENMIWDPQEAMHVCKICGNCYEDRTADGLMDTHFYKGTSVVKKVDYQEVVYFKTWLKSVEGQNKKTPPPQVIAAIKKMCYEYGIRYKRQVTPQRIRKFLQEWHPTKGPQYYMNVPYIISQITGEPCQQLTDEQRKNCIRRFEMVLRAYNDPKCPRKNTSSGDKRTSCPGYAYTTKKILQLEGLDKMARFICLFDQVDNIFQHDTMWKFICDKNGGAEKGWPFIRTI